MGFKTEGHINFYVTGPQCQLGELRKLVDLLDTLSIPDDYILDECIVEFNYIGDVELIEDGEYAPYRRKYDFLVVAPDYEKEGS